MASLKREITRNLAEVIEITKPVISIGRGTDNDIIISDSILSRHHCRICMEGSDIILEDVNSCSGLYVNGLRFSHKILQDKDCIKLGWVRIFFSTEKEICNSPSNTIDFTINDIRDYNRSELISPCNVFYKFFSDDKTLEQMQEIVREKLELIDVSDMIKINLDAAFHEATENAQKHGHKYNSKLPIEFSYIQKSDKLIMQVTDQGEGFDPDSEVRYKKEGRGYGGLGIMLMLKCVHKVEYNRKGNQVTLIRFLGETAEKFEEEERLRREEEEREFNQIFGLNG